MVISHVMKSNSRVAVEDADSEKMRKQLHATAGELTSVWERVNPLENQTRSHINVRCQDEECEKSEPQKNEHSRCGRGIDLNSRVKGKFRSTPR